MRSIRAMICLLASVASLTACGAGEPAPLQQRMWELEQQVNALAEAGDWDAAVVTIRAMAALDPVHPKPYLQTVLLQRRRGALDEAPAVFDQLGPGEGPGRLYGEGLLSFFNGDVEQASASFTRALEGYDAIGHLAGQAAGQTALGQVAKKTKRLDDAVLRFEAALGICETIGDRQALADTMNNLADVESLRGKHDAALDWLRRALAVRTEIGDAPGEARTWNHIGRSLSRSGDVDRAVEALGRSLAVRRRINDQPGQISTLKLLAGVYADHGRRDAALDSLEQALQIASIHPDRRIEAGLLRMQGESLLAAGRNREARASLESATDLYRELGHRRGLTNSLTLLGSALNELGEFRRAQQVVAEALELALIRENVDEEIAARINLGNADLATGELTRALVHHERALDLQRKTGDRAGERWTLNNIGAAWFALGDYQRAQRRIEQTLEIAEELGDAEAAALARHNLAVVLSANGLLEQAQRSAEQAILARVELNDRRGTALSRALSAEILDRLGRSDEAGELLARALMAFRESGDRGGEAACLNLEGERDHAAARFRRSVAAHRQALRLATDAGLPAEQWRAESGIARALLARGEREEAIEFSLAAIDRVESVREGLETGEFKMRFLARRLDLYERALSILLPAGAEAGTRDRATGFEISERARARSLLETLAESRSELHRRLPGTFRNREQQQLDRISAASFKLRGASDPQARKAARQELEQAIELQERLEIEIRRNAPEYGEILYPRPASLTSIQAILEPDESLLEYFVGRERAWLWVIDREQVRLHALDPPARIEKLVEEFVDRAGRPGGDLGGGHRDIEAAERLSAAILPRSALPAAGRLIVAPDGPLHHLPFEALRSDGRFLIEDHEVVVVPSATALRLMREQGRPSAAGGFLGIGDPAARPGDTDSPGLPFARQEVESIAALFPPQTRLLLTGTSATETTLRALDLQRFRYVHFATHGWLDAENRRLSGLKLSPSGGDGSDDLLSLDEILGLSLDSEVVILSACRSGLGELLAGEGLVGLTRAFLYAGSRTVVVSLWNVGDRSTADFMLAVYEGLRRGEGISAALRQAKISFLSSDRQDRRRILRWAPFVLVGNPGRPAGNLNRTSANPTMKR